MIIVCVYSIFRAVRDVGVYSIFRAVLSQSNSFLEVFRISPLSKSQSMIWFVGKSGVKCGNFSKWL